jgi:large subunit ribosomal protein L17
MRHGKKINHLSRTASHRKAMLSNMACSLIEHKRINTTLAKAKALRKYVEPLITKSKDDTTHNRRVVFKYLQNKDASSILFRDVAPKIADRPGGYTRIIKLNNRLGDNAEMAMIELVDFNELLLDNKPAKKKSRRRGGGKKSTSNASVSEDSSAKITESNDIIEDAVVVEETPNPVKEEVSNKKEETTDDDIEKDEKKD